MTPDATPVPLLRLDRVSEHFGQTEVLRDLSLEVVPGEFVALVGPSGCGKTTLLNLCSGWLQPSSGTLRRPDRVRMVFQHDGLFPWLTAGDNVRLGLRHLGDRAERERRATALLQLVGLETFADHYPHQLSGGMRQRVELARALGGDTDLLLMDEPFSSLDYLSRLRLRQELARLLREQPRTVVLVTHDIEEAAQLADRVLVLSERPATIRDEVRLTSPRPRSATQPDVVAAMHRILTRLGLEPGDAPGRPRADDAATAVVGSVPEAELQSSGREHR
jgi:NitT/TauT family transport system ATP-binding protein